MLKHAPKIITRRIPNAFIDLIGPGGKVIQELQLEQLLLSMKIQLLKKELLKF
jgi:polyribonucleotide nucleotidyltransferase